MAFGNVTPCSFVSGCEIPDEPLAVRGLSKTLLTTYITLVNKDFSPGKNVCFWCIFGRWMQIFFQHFFITHTCLSRLKGWNLLSQEQRCVLTVGTMKNSRIASLRNLVSCFGMMFVPLWHFLTMNITQFSGSCSLIFKRKPECGSPPQRE